MRIKCLCHYRDLNRNFFVTNLSQGFSFFSRLVGRSDPWSKKWRVIFWNDEPKHIKLTTIDNFEVYFTYSTLTADDTVKHFLSDHWKQKTNYGRSKLLQNAPFYNTFDLHLATITKPGLNTKPTRQNHCPRVESSCFHRRLNIYFLNLSIVSIVPINPIKLFICDETKKLVLIQQKDRLMKTSWAKMRPAITKAPDINPSMIVNVRSVLELSLYILITFFLYYLHIWKNEVSML